MYQKEITKEEIYELPLKKFEGETVIIDNLKDVDIALNEIKNESLLGFDTETKPSFKRGKTNINNVALLQLSTSSTAYLFRLNKIGMPDSLINLLVNKDIIKIGVALKEDLSSLRKIKDFIPGSFLDLQTYVKSFGIECASLKKLTAIVLNFRISKSQQLSNWEADMLSPGQIHYAATDAWVCIEIYKMLRLMEY